MKELNKEGRELIRIQINKEGLKQSFKLMFDEAIDLTLEKMNKENPEKIKNESDFKNEFLKLFPEVSKSIFPKDFLEHFKVDFKFDIDFDKYNVKIDYEYTPLEDEKK